MRSLIPRLRHQLQHHGGRGALSAAISRVQGRLYLDETHAWYELALSSDRPQQNLRPGLELIRGGADNLPLLDGFPGVNEHEARQRTEAGDDLWLVLDGRQPIFVCWTLRDSISLLAAWNGRLALPPKMVCLEDSFASPSYRGRGMIAPSAWSEIADRLERAGINSIITKVEVDNRVMRLLLTRSGFREIAVMRLRRAGFRQHTTLRPETGATADWLTEQTHTLSQLCSVSRESYVVFGKSHVDDKHIEKQVSTDWSGTALARIDNRSPLLRRASPHVVSRGLACKLKFWSTIRAMPAILEKSSERRSSSGISTPNCSRKNPSSSTIPTESTYPCSNKSTSRSNPGSVGADLELSTDELSRCDPLPSLDSQLLHPPLRSIVHFLQRTVRRQSSVQP